MEIEQKAIDRIGTTKEMVSSQSACCNDHAGDIGILPKILRLYCISLPDASLAMHTGEWESLTGGAP
jgi:hypothetical protein